MGIVPVLVGSVALVAPFLLTAVVVLGWLDLLRPAPRRRVVTEDRPWRVILWLWSVLVLLLWGTRLAGSHTGARHVLGYVLDGVIVVILAASFFILRPASRDLRRGLRLSKQGDLAGAAASYQRALGTARRREIPSAAFNLGCVRFRQGDLDGAGAAFRRTIGSGRPDLDARAALNLATVCDRLGDEQGARAAYEQVLGINGSRQAGKAAWRLGGLLERQGDAEGARAAYRRAIDHGPRDVREPAARALIELNLGMAGE